MSSRLIQEQVSTFQEYNRLQVYDILSREAFAFRLFMLHIFPKQPHACDRRKYLRKQQSPQISPDAVTRHKKPDHSDADQTGKKIDKKHLFRTAESVQDTAEQTGDIHEWTKPREAADEASGKCIVEKLVSDHIPSK